MLMIDKVAKFLHNKDQLICIRRVKEKKGKKQRYISAYLPVDDIIILYIKVFCVCKELQEIWEIKSDTKVNSILSYIKWSGFVQIRNKCYTKNLWMKIASSNPKLAYSPLHHAIQIDLLQIMSYVIFVRWNSYSVWNGLIFIAFLDNF